MPRITIKIELEDAVKDYEAARLKNQQLEREISEVADERQRSNMQHTRSKLWMFIQDAIPKEVIEQHRAIYNWPGTIGVDR